MHGPAHAEIHPALDISVFRSVDLYWNRFPEIFRPYHMLAK